jgi:hypothetical protein
MRSKGLLHTIGLVSDRSSDGRWAEDVRDWPKADMDR